MIGLWGHWFQEFGDGIVCAARGAVSLYALQSNLNSREAAKTNEECQDYASGVMRGS